MNEPVDPTPGIRAVFIAAFLGGNASALAYMAVRGKLLEAVQSNPLAILGGFLGIGLVGMSAGAICGLALRLVLEKMGGAVAGWWLPLASAVAVSALLGLFVVHCLFSVYYLGSLK